MREPRFPILGAAIPKMLGRSHIMQRIWNDLTKATPSNLSLIGPRFVGKTVIINALAQRAVNESSPYAFVLYWHLGHVSPVSDEDFIAQLCEQLRLSLSKSETDTSEYRAYLEDHSFGNLSEVTDILDDERLPILMLWDGFDKPLGQGKLTGHLWDQMRTLFYGKRHKIVTATRKPLSELIRSQDAISSPFWNIFDMNPVGVGPFDENDREMVIGLLKDHRFQAGATTEIFNWSAGIPPLFLGILNEIVDDVPSGTVDNKEVSLAANRGLTTLSHIVGDMWSDCPATAKDLYIQLVDRGKVLIAEAGKQETGCLLEMGLAQPMGNKLSPLCRMLGLHVENQEDHSSSMGRLFGSWDCYQKNIRGLLERRLAHISRFDERLYRLVERSIDDIPNYPDDCLNNLSGIRDCALKLIWQREFGTCMCVPQDVVIYWTESPRSHHRMVQGMINANCWDLPTEPIDQIRLLSLFTGSYRNFEAKARTVSKDAFVLIDAIHNFRNRAQHPDGQSIHLGVAVAALMTCLELLACLERELA